MAPIRVAIVGYGLSAKIFHLPFIHALPQHFALHAILQRTPTPTNNAARDWPTAKPYTSLEPLLADPAIDLVIITSVPMTHHAMVTSCLNAGKHVVCEKPFVPTSAEALDLAALAKAKGKILAVYQNRRWDADFLTVQQLVRERALGRIVEFESHFDRHRPVAPADAGAAGWKARETPVAGAVYDLGSHLLDQFLALFGLPERVTGFVGNQRVYEVEGTGGEAGGDSFTVLLHYDELGMLGTAKAGVVSAETDEQLRFWVRGTEGSFKKYQVDAQEAQLKEGLRPGDEQYGVEPAEANGILTTVEDGKSVARKLPPKSPPVTYTMYYELLAKAINEGGQPPVSAEENAKLLRLIELVKQSSLEQRTLKVAM